MVQKGKAVLTVPVSNQPPAVTKEFDEGSWKYAMEGIPVFTTSTIVTTTVETPTAEHVPDMCQSTITFSNVLRL
ncbi:hypothetical protein FQR65_LT06877 [Abscondita terminalis]|nr:hypothetical protein FQR65_LT06877 [Abscondita terminalis]